MIFQPLYGQTANIFGRRWLMIFAVSLFMVGSAVGGAAQSIAMLIAGRAIQVHLICSPPTGILTLSRELEEVEFKCLAI
jgi:MFS family permease